MKQRVRSGILIDNLMDIGSLDNQQLLRLIIFAGAGSLVFAVIFVFALIVTVRNWRKRHASASVLPAEQTFDEGNSPMPLLKAYGKKEADPKPPKLSASHPVPSIEKSADTVELLRVLMVRETRKIVVEVDGTRYFTLQAVPDRTIGQRILQSAAALLNFTRGIIDTAEGTKSIPIPAVAVSHLPLATATPNVPPPQEQTLPLGVQPRHISQPSAVAEKPKLGWGLRRKKPAKDSPEPPAFTAFNLAEQIDEILQAKLAAQNIRTEMKIHSAPGGGIRIQVDDRFFNAVDDLDDPTARSLIQSAIKEWERR